MINRLWLALLGLVIIGVADAQSSTTGQPRVRIIEPNEADEETAARDLVRERIQTEQVDIGLTKRPSNAPNVQDSVPQKIDNPVFQGLRMVQPAFQQGLVGMRQNLDAVAPLFGAIPRSQDRGPQYYLPAVDRGNLGTRGVWKRFGGNSSLTTASYPLYDAVRAGEIIRLRLLLQSGRNPNEPSPGGWTPLMAAAYYGNEACARALLAGGADPWLSTTSGATAYSVALKQVHYNIARLLWATRLPR